MTATTEQTPLLTQVEIAEAAWEMWEQEGRQQGLDQEYWFRAEQMLLAAKERETLEAMFYST